MTKPQNAKAPRLWVARSSRRRPSIVEQSILLHFDLTAKPGLALSERAKRARPKTRPSIDIGHGLSTAIQRSSLRSRLAGLDLATQEMYLSGKEKYSQKILRSLDFPAPPP